MGGFFYKDIIMNNKGYINTRIKLRKLQQQIQRYQWAKGMTENEIQQAIINNKVRNLISKTRPLELELFIYEVSENRKSKLNKLGRLVIVQRMARRAINKRSHNRAMHSAARRSMVVGAHHALSRAQLLRFLPPPAIRRHVAPKKKNTRSTTRLTRYLAI